MGSSPIFNLTGYIGYRAQSFISRGFLFRIGLAPMVSLNETNYPDSFYNAFNTFAWEYYERFDDQSKLVKATECVERSIELNSNYSNNDTYSWLLYKLGKYDKALKHAERAIELAKQNNLEYEETSDLIAKINGIK